MPAHGSEGGPSKSVKQCVLRYVSQGGPSRRVKKCVSGYASEDGPTRKKDFAFLAIEHLFFTTATRDSSDRKSAILQPLCNMQRH